MLPSFGLSRVRNLRQFTEVTANVVIVCALVLGGGVWLYRTMHPAPINTGSNPPPGTAITLPGVDWGAHPSTLVIAISTLCPHCENEAAFYSDLTRSKHRSPVVVVMPQQQQTAQSFLDEHHINPTNTISADLRNLQVRATPTIVLVSSSGVVKQTWVGELNDKQKTEVSSAIDRF